MHLYDDHGETDRDDGQCHHPRKHSIQLPKRFLPVVNKLFCFGHHLIEFIGRIHVRTFSGRACCGSVCWVLGD